MAATLGSINQEYNLKSSSTSRKAYELQKTSSSPEFSLKKIIKDSPERKKKHSSPLPSSCRTSYSPALHDKNVNKPLSTSTAQTSPNKAFRSGSGPLILQRSPSKSSNLFSKTNTSLPSSEEQKYSTLPAAKPPLPHHPKRKTSCDLIQSETGAGGTQANTEKFSKGSHLILDSPNYVRNTSSALVTAQQNRDSIKSKDYNETQKVALEEKTSVLHNPNYRDQKALGQISIKKKINALCSPKATTNTNQRLRVSKYTDQSPSETKGKKSSSCFEKNSISSKNSFETPSSSLIPKVHNTTAPGVISVDSPHFDDPTPSPVPSLGPLRQETEKSIPLSQQRIREEQERKLLELHKKNQQEIFDLRAKDSASPRPALSRSTSIGNEVPLALAKQKNRRSTLERVPIAHKLNRSHDGTSKSKKPLCGILKDTNNQSNTSFQFSEGRCYSFSGYLTRTRSKDSISTSEGQSLSSKLKENKKEKESESNKKTLCEGPKSLKGSYSILKSSSSGKKGKKVGFKEPELHNEKNDRIKDVNSIKDKDDHPVKPPRGEKSSKRSFGNSTILEQEVMKHQKTDPKLSKDPQPDSKQPSETKSHPQLQRVSYQPPTQKTETQQERRTSQTEQVEMTQQDRNKPQEHGSVPQPPTRGLKQTPKSVTAPPSTQTSVRRRTDSRCGPESILITACRVAEEDQIMRLLRDLSKNPAMFDANFINECDISGRTALSHSCSNGYYRVVEFLTSLTEVDLNMPDTECSTPLHYAAQGGHVEIVSHLVNTCSRQVDLDARNSLGFTPLMKAALQGRTKIAKILLFAGASPHLRDYGRGMCALEWAKYTGRNACSDLIESVQRSCSSHIRDRWTSDPDLKLYSGTGLQHHCGVGLPNDNKESWLKHKVSLKIKKAFHKSDSKKEFSVASNLSNLAACVSSPLVPCQPQVNTEPLPLPKVQVTEVNAPDCYFDPGGSLSSPSSDDYSSGEGSPNSSSPTSPDEHKQGDGRIPGVRF